MQVSNVISFRVSKIIQKNRFVKDILNSIDQLSGRALLVGGAVRDIFLQLPVKDLDFEVYGLTLEQLQEILQQYGPVSFMGKSFGVLRVHGLDVDWSLPRKDSSGRHPVVAYDPTMSYEQAFARRDLTINAIGIDMQTFELIDPYNGLQDLEDQILRATDLDFFGQDPLRLLRVMQFAGRFEMKVDEQLSQLCMVMDISKVSHERIEQEFSKLFLQSRRPSVGLQWLLKIGKFHELLPGVEVVAPLWSKLNFGAGLTFTNDQEKLVMMWAIVASFLKTEKKSYYFAQLHHKDKLLWINFMKYISRHDQLIQQVAGLVSYAQIIPEVLTDAQIKWLAVWLAPELSIRLLSQFMVIRYGAERATKVAEQAAQVKVMDAPEDPLLTGKDLLDVAQGIELGKLVKAAYNMQIDQGLTDRFVLKALLLKQ
jgi:tRNA nucleotidyltransferase/poly(A) polymerase